MHASAHSVLGRKKLFRHTNNNKTDDDSDDFVGMQKKCRNRPTNKTILINKHLSDAQVKPSQLSWKYSDVCVRAYVRDDNLAYRMQYINWSEKFALLCFQWAQWNLSWPIAAFMSNNQIFRMQMWFLVAAIQKTQTLCQWICRHCWAKMRNLNQRCDATNWFKIVCMCVCFTTTFYPFGQMTTKSERIRRRNANLIALHRWASRCSFIRA